eukprot:scaffold52362_cov39-Prasinocladus_malaysianus.AAC.1
MASASFAQAEQSFDYGGSFPELSTYENEASSAGPSAASTMPVTPTASHAAEHVSPFVADEVGSPSERPEPRLPDSDGGRGFAPEAASGRRVLHGFQTTAFVAPRSDPSDTHQNHDDFNCLRAGDGEGWEVASENTVPESHGVPGGRQPIVQKPPPPPPRRRDSLERPPGYQPPASQATQAWDSHQSHTPQPPQMQPDSRSWSSPVQATAQPTNEHWSQQSHGNSSNDNWNLNQQPATSGEQWTASQQAQQGIASTHLQKQPSSDHWTQPTSQSLQSSDQWASQQAQAANSAYNQNTADQWLGQSDTPTSTQQSSEQWTSGLTQHQWNSNSQPNLPSHQTAANANWDSHSNLTPINSGNNGPGTARPPTAEVWSNSHAPGSEQIQHQQSAAIAAAAAAAIAQAQTAQYAGHQQPQYSYMDYGPIQSDQNSQ